MRTAGNNLFHLFFPRLCASCKAILTEREEEICLHCLCNLPRNRFYLREDNPILRLFAAKVDIVHATAFLQYGKGNKTRRLVHSFKYGGNQRLAFLLGRHAALELPFRHTGYRDAEILIPVPLHAEKERKRGYNQSEQICDGLASAWNIPVRTDVLKRSMLTYTQTGKKLYERWRNMQEVFLPMEPDALKGRHVLLVDDVITSGSTLTSCAEALLQTRDVRLSIFSLSAASNN
jgi:ComF family protein